ncbi:MAG: hypothetical protein ACKERG_01400 [Candidatus Hodgkinia cicadicola]
MLSLYNGILRIRNLACIHTTSGDIIVVGDDCVVYISKRQISLTVALKTKCANTSLWWWLRLIWKATVYAAF